MPHVLHRCAVRKFHGVNGKAPRSRERRPARRRLPSVKHVILMCPAVNHIDASALESLEAINRNLREAGITFHLSEVKGPVLGRLRRSHFSPS